MVLGITLKEAESVFVSKRDVDHCKCSCSLLVECNKSISCKVIGQFCHDGIASETQVA